MTTTPPDWIALGWESTAAALGLEFMTGDLDHLTVASKVYGTVTLSEKSGAITVNVTQLPGLTVPKGFRLNGSLESPIQVPYLQDGALIPASVLAYRLECALQGRAIDLQRGLSKSGVRATPDQIRQLRTGTIIEVIQEQHYFKAVEDQEVAIKVGERLTLQSIEINHEDYQDGADLEDADLEAVDWLRDGVWAVYLSGEAKLEVMIGLMFSDFVVAAAQTLDVAPDAPIPPESR